MKTDSQIQTDFMQKLKWDPNVTREHIGVAVTDGIVTLSGTVPTYIEKAAQRVSDVKAVIEKIEAALKRKAEREVLRGVLQA